MHSYIPVADENSTSLSAVFSAATSMEDFLGKDERMPFHPVKLEDPSTEVNINFEFDGLMVEVSSLAGVKAGIHRLRLPDYHPMDIRNHFPQLRKMLPIEGIGDEAFKTLSNGVRGVTLVTADSQLDVMLSTVPSDLKHPDPRFNNPRWVRAEVLDELNNFVLNVKALFKKLPVREKHRPTIMKTVLSDLSSMDIVADDKQFIMTILDEALARSRNAHFRLMVTLHRFGQKCKKDIPLGDIVDLTVVKTVSVHAAMTNYAG